MPKINEFANTVGQTIHFEDEDDSEEGSKSKPESQQESEPEFDTV